MKEKQSFPPQKRVLSLGNPEMEIGGGEETCGRSREQVASSLASIEGVSASIADLSSTLDLLFPTEKTLESPTITLLWILARRFHVG